MADDVEQRIDLTRHDVTSRLAHAGDWLSGADRIDAWSESRLAEHHPLDRARRSALSPMAVSESHLATEKLSAAAVEVVHRIASDPGRLNQAWADNCIADLGAEIYTELVGVTAIARTIDTYAIAMNSELTELPEPVSGESIRVRPTDVGEVGAWVPQTIDKLRANVSRALSLVPATNAIWRDLVDTHYSRGQQFMNLKWDRALSRVQVEAIAARTTIALDCFY